MSNVVPIPPHPPTYEIAERSDGLWEVWFVNNGKYGPRSPHLRLGARRVVYNRADLNAWAASRREGGVE
jgi:hypothetical protein